MLRDCRYMYEGYLYSSTVDFLSTSQTDLVYTWVLLVIGYLLPNLLILLSHLAIIIIYRNNNFDAWLSRQGSVEPRNNYVTHHRLEVGMQKIFQKIFVFENISNPLSLSFSCLKYLPYLHSHKDIKRTMYLDSALCPRDKAGLLYFMFKYDTICVHPALEVLILRAQYH